MSRRDPVEFFYAPLVLEDLERVEDPQAFKTHKPDAIPAPDVVDRAKQRLKKKPSTPHVSTLSQTERQAAIQIFDGIFPRYKGLLNATVIGKKEKST